MGMKGKNAFLLNVMLKYNLAWGLQAKGTVGEF